jgi:hypothetical protein
MERYAKKGVQKKEKELDRASIVRDGRFRRDQELEENRGTDMIRGLAWFRANRNKHAGGWLSF